MIGDGELTAVHTGQAKGSRVSRVKAVSLWARLISLGNASEPWGMFKDTDDINL